MKISYNSEWHRKSWFDRVTDVVADQIAIFADDFGAGAVETRSLAGGMLRASEELQQLVGEELRRAPAWARAAAGVGVSAVRLAAAAPLAMGDMGIHAVKAAPSGPLAIVGSVANDVVGGIFYSGVHVVSRVSDWATGAHSNGSDAYVWGQDAGDVVATVLMLIAGGRGIARGASGIGGSVARVAGEAPQFAIVGGELAGGAAAVGGGMILAMASGRAAKPNPRPVGKSESYSGDADTNSRQTFDDLYTEAQEILQTLRDANFDHKIARALATTGGRRHQAAKLLHIGYRRLMARLDAAPPRSPLFIRKNVDLRGKRHPKHSDAAIADAMKAQDYHVGDAAGALGMCASDIYRRIRQARPRSPLFELKGERAPRRRPRAVIPEKQMRLEEFFLALERTESDVPAAAAILGKPVRAVTQYVFSSDHPDIKWHAQAALRQMRVKGPAQPGPEVATLRRLLKKYHGDRQQVAREMGKSWRWVNDRILDNVQFLHKYVGMKGKPVAEIKVLPKRMLALLKKHRGNRSQIAQELQVNRKSVTAHIERHKGDPGFAHFLGVDGRNISRAAQKNIGRPRTVNDKKLVKVLERVGGNRAAASRELQKEGVKMTPGAIGRRAQKAPPGSRLAEIGKLGARPRSK